jgi:hypothetical protein
MKIRIYDSITRYLVESESVKDQENLVDLLSLETNGECSCEDFRMVKMPNLRDGTGPTQCKHILAVRQFFLMSTLALLAKQETEAKVKIWTNSIKDS